MLPSKANNEAAAQGGTSRSHSVLSRLIKKYRTIRGGRTLEHPKRHYSRPARQLNSIPIRGKTPSVSSRPISDISHTDWHPIYTFTGLKSMDPEIPLSSDQEEPSRPTCPDPPPFIANPNESRDRNKLQQDLCMSMENHVLREEPTREDDPATKLEPCTGLEGVGSRFGLAKERQDAHANANTPTPIPSGKNMSRSQGAAVPHWVRPYADQAKRPSGTNSWGTTGSNSTSSSTDYPPGRATSPTRYDIRPRFCRSPSPSVASSRTSTDSVSLDGRYEGETVQNLLAGVEKRMSSHSESSADCHSEHESANRRQPNISPDANIDSKENAKKLVESLNTPSSHDGTEDWVSRQRLVIPPVQRMEGAREGEEAPNSNACFQLGTALALKSGFLTPIEEVQSDTGRSTPASAAPLAKSATSQVRSCDSTEATSVSGDFAEPIEPDEITETDLYSEISDTEDISVWAFDSPLDPMIRGLFLTLKDAITFIVLQSLQEWIQSLSPGQGSGTNYFDSQSGLGSTPNETDSSGQDGKEGGSKRRRDNDEGNRSGGDNNDDPGKRRKISISSGKIGTVEVFACPFVKRYPEEEWPKCRRGWSEIRHLKTHLYRNHTLDLLCPKCFVPFQDSDVLAAHLRDATCPTKDESQRPHGLTTKMHNEVRSRKGVQNLPGREYWERIYKIIFPNDPVPLDPYFKSESAELAAALAGLIDNRELKNHLTNGVTESLKDLFPAEQWEEMTRRVHDSVQTVFVSLLPKPARETMETGATENDSYGRQQSAQPPPEPSRNLETVGYTNLGSGIEQPVLMESAEKIGTRPLQGSQGEAQPTLPSTTVDNDMVYHLLFGDNLETWHMGQGMAEGNVRYTQPAQSGEGIDQNRSEYS